MDDGEFRNSTFQRVYQYLRRQDKGQKLDRFKYQGTVEGKMADCLQHFLRYDFDAGSDIYAGILKFHITVGVVEYRIHRGLKSIILPSSWIYSSSPVKNPYSVMKHLLVMSCLA